MKGALNLTLVQAHLQWRDPARNREHLEQLIRSTERSDLYILPETFTTGFLGESRKCDEGMDGPTVVWMQELAGELDAAICGSAVIQSDEGRRNRLLLVSADGIVSYYDKKHLFAFAGEDKRYVAGTERVVFDHQGWRICPQICYDLRFPVWCRSQGDYDLLLFVANWPRRRVDAWDALLRARAIENQCYVAAVNRVGEDGNGVDYPGHSAIYSPLGEALVPPWETEACHQAVINLKTVRTIRRDLPFAHEADRFRLVN